VREVRLKKIGFMFYRRVWWINKFKSRCLKASKIFALETR